MGAHSLLLLDLVLREVTLSSWACYLTLVRGDGGKEMIKGIHTYSITRFDPILSMGVNQKIYYKIIIIVVERYISICICRQQK